MRCNACDTALGYNLLHQWWTQNDRRDQFYHDCPWCPASIHVQIHTKQGFLTTTFLDFQHVLPKHH